MLKTENDFFDGLAPNSDWLNDPKANLSSKVIVNSKRDNLLNELNRSFEECNKFYLAVAFINFSGLQLLLNSLKEAEKRGVEGKILTSTYLNFTDVKSMRKLKTFDNIDSKVFIASNQRGFHTKAYIFENDDHFKIIIGSSNITQSALKTNVEWNVLIISKKEHRFVDEVIKRYEEIWEASNEMTENFLQTYEEINAKFQSLWETTEKNSDELAEIYEEKLAQNEVWPEGPREEISNIYDEMIKQIKTFQTTEVLDFEAYQRIEPNYMQRMAMENLQKLRDSNETKALIIAATGTGKTYLSAFDVLQFAPKRMLFVVHREEILKSAKKTFNSIMKNKGITMGLFTGNEKDASADYLFATNMTMEKNLHQFPKDHFDYVIIDEAHHASSATFKGIINYFEPAFLLGMTATPERGDGDDIFEIFGNNVAVDIKLKEALSENLIAPFHYFGITDVSGADLQDVDLNKTDEVAKRLMIHSRVDFVIEKMEFYEFDGPTQKAIGFCVNVDHAKYMCEEFNRKGIQSEVLTGADSQSRRQDIIEKLQSDQHPLQIIFTVDIFNEGVDIPQVNQILMLRPTNSPIIFTQQLGRGLRKHSRKAYLTVLDFIGNHNRAFLMALALSGKVYDKDTIKTNLKTDFIDLPGVTNISMDKIAKEQILQQLESENFYSKKYIVEEYKNFKASLAGKIPYRMNDYLKLESAPDPIKFINNKASKVPSFDGSKTMDSRSYLEFLYAHEEGLRVKIGGLFQDVNFRRVIRELSGMLPIKRPHEFMVLKTLIDRHSLTIKEATIKVNGLVVQEDDAMIVHAFRALSQDFYDSSEKKNHLKLCEFDGERMVISQAFKEVVQNLEKRLIIEDILSYGLNIYREGFGSVNYGMPFLKLYEQYSQRDAAVLSCYEKSFSAFRGSGLLTNGNDFFLFVELHKEAGIDERINYKDKIISETLFQWQTPNNTTQGSDRGKNILFNRERNINLHMFVRKFKEIDGVTQPYIYIGKCFTQTYEGEKPITIIFELEHRISDEVYLELTTS